MDVFELSVRDVKRLVPNRFGDGRGFFSELWNCQRMASAGLEYRFVQDNLSLSSQPNTIRGLHYQTPPHAQAKLVTCLRGAIRDVCVDIRRGSPTFGQWVVEELSAENGAQLLIPVGFLHGFVTLEPDTMVLYKVDAPYAPECDRSIRFDDPELAIDWGIDSEDAILSEKDARAPRLGTAGTPFDYEGTQ